MTTAKHNKRTGAAMVEALIALPVLLLIFIGLPNLYAIGHARHQTQRESRLSTWEQALAGCPSSTEACGGNGELVDASLTGIAIVDDALDALWGRAVGNAASQQLTAPTIVGGDVLTIQARQCVLCNPTRSPAKDVVLDTYESKKRQCEGNGDC